MINEPHTYPNKLKSRLFEVVRKNLQKKVYKDKYMYIKKSKDAEQDCRPDSQ